MTHIAIVGAGIAGLNAALSLQDAGLSCSIYEASHRIGGRMHSDAITWADGMGSSFYGLESREQSALNRVVPVWRYRWRIHIPASYFYGGQLENERPQ